MTTLSVRTPSTVTNFCPGMRWRGYVKVRYRGLAKNMAQMLTLFALSNFLRCNFRPGSHWSICPAILLHQVRSPFPRRGNQLPPYSCFHMTVSRTIALPWQMALEMELIPRLNQATAMEAKSLCDSLQRFNHPYVGDAAQTPVQIVATCGDGPVLGGILADVCLGWLEVHVLWVDPSARHRGLGSDLLKECERLGKARGAHSARLDTFDWQAETFYAQHGYKCFARLDSYPVGHQRIFMSKQLPSGC